LSVALALTAGVAFSQTTSGVERSGEADLGVDISPAGKTRAQNREFMSRLSRDELTLVRIGCVLDVEEANLHAPEVIAFCGNVADM
jgi:hypothetical protein